MTRIILTAFAPAISLVSSAADSPSVAAQAVNAFGLDLMAKGAATNENALLSPYSIQTAMAMTYAGAAGETRAEMAKVLHYPTDEVALHQSFAALQKVLNDITKTFMALDEKGTEAAAATTVKMPLAMEDEPKSIELRVDRPFLFAIQHGPSWTCLFVGRVTDPR